MYPKKVTFVGFPFKKQRIMMHFSVISAVVPNFTYDGAALTAEAISEISKRLSYPLHIPTTTDLYSPKIDASTRASFQVSKNGCSPELLNKRIKRNPFHLVHSYYYSSTAELSPFFGDCFNKHF